MTSLTTPEMDPSSTQALSLNSHKPKSTISRRFNSTAVTPKSLRPAHIAPTNPVLDDEGA